MNPRPLSFPAVAVLHAVASGVPYGFEILDATSLPSGTVYPILSRLERDGYVRSTWENARIAQGEKRPRRRYYRITAHGERVLEDSVERFRALAPIHPTLARARG